MKNKMQELFQAIQESPEYRSYLNIGSVIEQDDEIVSLVNEIKRLQQKSVELEYHHDEGYKEIDKEIDKKVADLNSRPIYQEYLRRMNEFNNILDNCVIPSKSLTIGATKINIIMAISSFNIMPNNIPLFVASTLFLIKKPIEDDIVHIIVI